MPTVWALVDVRGEDGELHGDCRRIRLPDPVSPEVQAVGRRLWQLRRAARITLYEMYQRALIPVARLSDIERGYVVATAEELAAIARVIQSGAEEG
jgi:hypothetical protein